MGPCPWQHSIVQVNQKSPRARSLRVAPLLLLVLGLGAGINPYRRPGQPLVRSGDEIVVAGQLFHTGTRVITWMDPGGYDAYRVERRFAPLPEASWEFTRTNLPAKSSPNRYGLRQEQLNPEQAEQVRGGGWPLAILRNVVDQFVIHFDASGTSRRCFEVLHDKRCLSVHFMIDLDGTVYQTLDLKERAWHATTSNGRSVGVELASPGAFPPGKEETLGAWYTKRADGKMMITPPGGIAAAGFKVPGYTPTSARSKPIEGSIQGQALKQYDFTDAQYRSLVKLSAALCSIFPRLKCDYPKDEKGKLITRKLEDSVLKNYQGLLGHYHLQTDKVDPGPAFDWDRVIKESRRQMRR